MFEGIKIVSTLECVRGFIPKRWNKIRQEQANKPVFVL